MCMCNRNGQMCPSGSVCRFGVVFRKWLSRHRNTFIRFSESCLGAGCSGFVRAGAHPMVCGTPRATAVLTREVARRAIAHRSARGLAGR